MNEQVVPSAVEQRITVKFMTNENVKPYEIPTRLKAQFDDETLPCTQVYDWSKSFKEGRREAENMRGPQLLQRKLWQVFLGTIKVSYSTP
jgi:hypothetical protein